jgi:(+)-trans-carveol dehydrogenase
MGNSGLAAYAAAQHGVAGFMRSLAIQLGEHGSRVNILHPGNTAPKIPGQRRPVPSLRPDLPDPQVRDVELTFSAMNVLPLPYAEPEDVSNAVLFLASDESRCITGLTMTVDLGATIKGARLLSPATG